MIRILIVDDHPAVRAGLVAVLRSEPGLVPVGSAAEEQEGWKLVQRARPDLVLLDLHMPGGNSLALCRRVKAFDPHARVLIYSAFAHDELAVAATLAGADGMIDKTEPVLELFNGIRRVHRGERLLAPVTPERLQDARARIPQADWPIVAMLLDGTPGADMAQTLGVRPQELEGRIERLLARLAPTVSRARA
ncbi:response regulator transcription factor [Conexibacter sp. CPCC 206217]|nr:response regulator transcription factor [Conexibacter sp. CPCC 206217]